MDIWQIHEIYIYRNHTFRDISGPVYFKRRLERMKIKEPKIIKKRRINLESTVSLVEFILKIGDDKK